MRRAAISICAGIVCAASASSAQALGFGAISSNTVLGQPLSFSVPLRMEGDEFVSVECISAEVHSGDVRVPPSQVRVALDGAREGGERMVRITTSALIDEPVVTVEVGVGCPVRLSRKFVAFIDPPVITLAEAAPESRRTEAAPADIAPARAEPPFTTLAPPPRASRPPVQRAPRAAAPGAARPVARPSVLAAADPAIKPRERAATEPAAKVAPAAAPAATGGARLKLEAADAARAPPAPLAAASLPAASASTADRAAPAAAQASASLAESTMLAQASPPPDRVLALEESMARLRSDTDAARGNIATLQARLREAEASRYANPLVYALVALIVLLILALATLLGWARAREQQRADWWAASSEEHAMRPRARAPVPEQPPERDRPDSVASVGVVESVPGPPRGPLAWKPTLAIPELDKNDVRKRAVTAEELIDLEQQAEFFVTLGQDDSAIDLLVGHLNSSGGISPLPYLKLLEIHRRRGDTAAHERIREHFNQRFNAYIPGFDASQTPARSLEEHPEVMAQLQGAWPTPPRAMGLLESLLFRQGGGDAAFDLAAYREILFLHEVARDLYEHDLSPLTVDVLLPLDDDLAAGSSNPLVSTTPVMANPRIEPPIGVDLDLGRPRDEEAEQAAARAEHRKERYGDGDFLFGSRTGANYTGIEDLDKPGSRGRKGSK